jgi:hypothetical protein
VSGNGINGKWQYHDEVVIFLHQAAQAHLIVPLEGLAVSVTLYCLERQDAIAPGTGAGYVGPRSSLEARVDSC